MDRYSHPVKEEKTVLSRLFYLKPRENPEKPGRSLRVTFDTRFPLIKDFKPEYIYTVEFNEPGSQAGNHYHREKSELFYPVAGDFEVHLQDTQSRKSETITLRAENHVALYIKPGIVHKVVSKNKDAKLLVVASAPNIEGDEFTHDVKHQSE